MQNRKIDIKSILFLDIETVPEFRSFSDLSDQKKELFSEKTKYQRKDEISAQDFYVKAGIWAEFGKIVCISVGYFVTQENFRVKSFYGYEELQILIGFKQLLNSYFNKKNQILCAHNGKEFDFPYIARRMIIHRIKLPQILNLFGKKPWEVPHLDTMEMWKFGDYKHFTSLKLLTHILGIPSPKDDIDGSEVAQIFYGEKDIRRIANYCEKDTIAMAQLLLRFYNYPTLDEKNITRI